MRRSERLQRRNATPQQQQRDTRTEGRQAGSRNVLATAIGDSLATELYFICQGSAVSGPRSDWWGVGRQGRPEAHGGRRPPMWLEATDTTSLPLVVRGPWSRTRSNWYDRETRAAGGPHGGQRHQVAAKAARGERWGSVIIWRPEAPMAAKGRSGGRRPPSRPWARPRSRETRAAEGHRVAAEAAGSERWESVIIIAETKAFGITVTN